MPSSIRRLACIVAAIVVLACPAAASATATGGVAPPSSTTPTGSVSTPTGGSAPTPPVEQPKPKPKKKKRKKPPTPSSNDGPGAADIPSDYLALYKSAAASEGFSWRILAAIGKNESDHGRSTLPGIHSGLNLANCCAGPMQLCTQKSCGETWQAYAVDADGDGSASVYDPPDAIYAAASLVGDLKNIFGNHPGLILAAYNAGPGNVLHYDGVPPFPETQAYVKHGLAYMGDLK